MIVAEFPSDDETDYESETWAENKTVLDLLDDIDANNVTLAFLESENRCHLRSNWSSRGWSCGGGVQIN